MSEEQGEERFDKTVTLEMIREKVQQFATERDWDQVWLSLSMNEIVSSTS